MSEKTILTEADLVTTLSDKIQELEKGLSDLLEGGISLASAEKEYRVTLMTKTLRLKKAGMPAGIIEKAIYGDEEVATSRYQRDVAQVVYDTLKERINATKLEIRVLEGQISREYSGA